LLKDSVYAGHAIDVLQEEENLSGVEVANALNISPQLLSNIKNGHRRLHKDIAKASLDTYDCPIYTMEILHEFSGGYTPPVLKGKAIEWHRLALEEFAIQETKEAIRILDEVSLIKPPGETTNQEKERIGQVIDELLDAVAAINNLNAILSIEYGISIKDRYKKRLPEWKAKGWI